MQKLRNWIFNGSKAVQEAKEKKAKLLEKLGQKGSLKKAKADQLKSANLTIFLHYFKVLILLIITLTILAAISSLVFSFLKTREEKKIDQLIQNVETGFLDFEKKMKPKIKEISNKNLQKNLLIPFEYFKLNQTNKEKNFKRYLRTRKNNQLEGILRKFFFDIQPKGMKAVSSFGPTTRTLRIDRDLDENSIFDMLAIYHETWHIVQDSHRRKNIRTERDEVAYQRLFNLQGGTICYLDQELEAFAYTIEILNLLMDGKLKRKEEIDVAKYVKKFRIKKHHIKGFEFILVLAENYYPQGFGKSFPSDYSKKMIAIHQQNGDRVCRILGNQLIEITLEK